MAFHDAHTSGHPGIEKTWENAKACQFYWLQMHETTADYVRACQICEERNDPPCEKRHRMASYVLGGRFKRIAVDISGPFPTLAQGNSYILAVGDYFAKLSKLYPLSNITAGTVADNLFRGWIKRYVPGRYILIRVDSSKAPCSRKFVPYCRLG